jgi:Uma2 family endonuclease
MVEAARRPDRQRFTYEDYRSWSGEDRWEIIDGLAYDMTPGPSTVHGDISGELFAALKTFLKGKPCRVYHAPLDVRLPKANELPGHESNVVQPDIFVVCDQKKLDEKGCRGAPDLVIEVLSPSTASKDCVIKRALYEKHGVRELWLVDPANRLVMVFNLGPDGMYAPPAMFSDEDEVEVGLFPELKIDLRDVFPAQPVRTVREPPREK